MENFAKEFIGKFCIIYLMSGFSSQIVGTVKGVNSNGILISDKEGRVQLINLDYVTRIREYPVNKKGKTKNFVLD